MKRLGGLWGFAAVALGCATLADTGGGDVALPNAAAGPFRELAAEELGNSRPAPYALRDDEDYPRDPSVVDLDGDPATLEVLGYVAETHFVEGVDPDPTALPNAIERYRAIDGRSFSRQHDTVLEPELDWEGGWVGQPCAVLVEGQIWLYYGAEGGIGLGKSDDGLVFSRQPEPVLGADPAGWASGAVARSPAVIALPAGGFRLFYEVESSAGASGIGEASSADGQHWEPVGDGPSLAPREPGDDPGSVYDSAWVGAPHAVLSSSPEGRTLLWLYYAALDGAGRRTIAVAARDGVDGPWHRATTPVFGASGSLAPTEPWVLRYPGFTLLFTTGRGGSSDDRDYPAVVAGVAPGNAALPPPEWE